MGLVRLPMSEGRAILDAVAQRKLGAKVNTAGGKRATHKTGVMNKLEAAFEKEVLYPAKLRGEIIEYWFETITFRLADGVRYTPDFVAQAPTGNLVIYETKGFMREDARIKLRVCANQFKRWQVYLCRRPNKSDPWSIELVRALE